MARTPVAWTLPARQDLLRAVEYLVQEAEAPRAAADLIDSAERAAIALGEYPQIGHAVPELGLPRRELLVAGYRLIYRVRTEVEILRLIHGRRDFLTAWESGETDEPGHTRR